MRSEGQKIERKQLDGTEIIYDRMAVSLYQSRKYINMGENDMAEFAEIFNKGRVPQKRKHILVNSL